MNYAKQKHLLELALVAGIDTAADFSRFLIEAKKILAQIESAKA